MIINAVVRKIDGGWQQMAIASEMLGQIVEVLTAEGAVELALASRASVAVDRIMILPKGKRTIAIMDIDDKEVQP